MAEFFEDREKSLLAAVAHGNRDIAKQAAMLRALDRRSAKHFAKFFQAETGQPFQTWVYQRSASFEFRRAGEQYELLNAYVHHMELADGG